MPSRLGARSRARFVSALLSGELLREKAAGSGRRSQHRAYRHRGGNPQHGPGAQHILVQGEPRGLLSAFRDFSLMNYQCDQLHVSHEV